jgi:hypothetical protein
MVELEDDPEVGMLPDGTIQEHVGDIRDDTLEN